MIKTIENLKGFFISHGRRLRAVKSNNWCKEEKANRPSCIGVNVDFMKLRADYRYSFLGSVFISVEALYGLSSNIWSHLNLNSRDIVVTSIGLRLW